MYTARLALVVAAPLLLVSCLLTPGKFVSTLDIRKDRSFAFTYAGEVIAAEDKMSEASDCEEGEPDCDPKSVAEKKAKRAADQEVKLREVAEALGREAGYRSVEYLGQRRFRVDYATGGRLDRNFIYPFNSDAAAIIPWVAIELRKDGTARMKAPGFGEEETMSAPGMPGPLGEGGSEKSGTFTLTTDAELVMHNEESGAQPGQSGGKKVVWRVTPTTKAAPTAVLRFSN